MNKLFTLLGSFLLASASFGQVVIHLDDEPMVAYNGDTVFVVGTESVVYPHMHIVNPTGSAQNYKWKRIFIDSTPGFTDQLCDDVLCWNCSGDPWVRPLFISIPSLDSSLFEPKLNTNGSAGTAHFRYYILDGSEAVIDSVDIHYTTTVGTQEFTKFDYKLYPNPANGSVNLVLPEVSGEVKFVLYNMVGSEVLRQTVVQGSNTINCESLQNGVYFYSIIRNNELVETKKLIIKH